LKIVKKKENNTDELTPKRFKKETFKAKEKADSFFLLQEGTDVACHSDERGKLEECRKIPAGVFFCNLLLLLKGTLGTLITYQHFIIIEDYNDQSSKRNLVFSTID
jgi:hypothetical protein